MGSAAVAAAESITVVIEAIGRIVIGIQVIGRLYDLVAVVVAIGFVDGNAASGIIGGLFADAVVGGIVAVANLLNQSSLTLLIRVSIIFVRLSGCLIYYPEFHEFAL